MRGVTTYDEDANLQIATFVLDIATKCTSAVPELCNAPVTQWLLIRDQNSVTVKGRCSVHTAADSKGLLQRVLPNVETLIVITHDNDFAEVIS